MCLLSEVLKQAEAIVIYYSRINFYYILIYLILIFLLVINY